MLSKRQADAAEDRTGKRFPFLRLFVSVLPHSVRYSFPEARSLSAWSGISSLHFGKDTTKDKGSSPVGRKRLHDNVKIKMENKKAKKP